MDTLITILIGLVCLVIGLLIGYLVRKKLAEARIKSAEEAAAKILIEAKKESETRKKEAFTGCVPKQNGRIKSAGMRSSIRKTDSRKKKRISIGSWIVLRKKKKLSVRRKWRWKTASLRWMSYSSKN